MTAEAEVRAAEERLRQGDLSPEPDTSRIFDERLADDVLFIQPAGNSVGKSGILRGHRPPRKRTFSKVEVSDLQVRDLGSVVAVACRTDFTTGDRSFALRTTRLWKKIDGSWKVVLVSMMGVD